MSRRSNLSAPSAQHPKGKRVFFVMGRVNGKQVQYSIGPFGTYTEDAARKRAQKLLQDMREGIDPREAKRENGKKAPHVRVILRISQVRQRRCNHVAHGGFVRARKPIRDRRITVCAPTLFDRRDEGISPPFRLRPLGQKANEFRNHCVGSNP
jgi:hypothetical protein